MKLRRTHGRTRFFNRAPEIIGISLILMAAIIGWIAYKANLGLPFQSRYVVNVQVPNADRLIAAADVRIGGVLVGEVLHVSAVPGHDGAPPYAKLKLGLQTSVGHLPIDSTAQVRPASVLGLTYVDLHLGRSTQTIPPNGTLPLKNGRVSSDLTDLLDIFEPNSARALQRAITAVAYGFAGRGTAINSTIESIDQLLPHLTNVAGTLAAPSTRLAPFLSAYELTVAALDPVGAALANDFRNGSTTFGAMADARAALAATIDAAPGAESSTATAFHAVLPSLNGLAKLTVDLRPAGALLPGSLEQINTTLAAGVPALVALPPFSRPLRAALISLNGLARDQATDGSLRKLYNLAVSSNTVLGAALPAQLGCNVLGLWGDKFFNVLGSNGQGEGPGLADLVLTGLGANDEVFQNSKPSDNAGIDPIPHEDYSECESGNEPWSGHLQLGNPSGLQSNITQTTAPPPGVLALAQKAGLLKPIPGAAG